MAAVYFDASALVKLILRETDNLVARSIWSEAEVRHASRLSFVETRAAASAAHRNHQIDGDHYVVAVKSIGKIRTQLRSVHLTEEVGSHAADLAHGHALKGADAIHLASALALQDPALVFATWDRRLHAAAQAVGLRVAPVAIAEHPPQPS